MSESDPRIQSLMQLEQSHTDDPRINLSFNTDDISFELLEMTFEEVEFLITELVDQLALLKNAYVRLTQIRKAE